jgi:prepilin-type N-terminal cleavage/methylation domain-containing protein
MNVRQRRPGFTLIELLVVIAIIGLLIALTLPALSGAREAGRRTQCLNNMKNISLGVVNYVNKKNRYPNLGTWGEAGPADSGYPRAQQINSNTLDVITAETSGNPTGHDLGPLYSWVVEILPDIDNQTLYNDFNRNRVYFDDVVWGLRPPAAYDGFKASNLTIGNTPIASFQCPNDDTVLQGRGNLSYVGNMGFTRWQFDGVNGYGWAGGATGGSPAVMSWGPIGVGNPGGYGSFKKSGLMFLNSKSGRFPWDIYNNTASVRDGASQTIMLAENSVGGASEGGQPYGWILGSGSGGTPVPTNWATPHPNFVGFMGSDNICASGGGNCAAAADLLPIAGKEDGPGWVRASQKGSFEEINYGAKNVSDQGGHPFANSLHPGLVIVSFCDGSAKAISDDVNGTVWAKLITPDGQTMPVTANGGYRQLPLQSDQIPGS